MLNQLFVIATFLLVIFSFGLGFFSLWKNPKSFTVRLWFLTNMAAGIWSTGLLFILFSTTEREIILYSNILHVGASFIPIFFCHFVSSFLYKDKGKKIFLNLVDNFYQLKS